MGLSTLVKDTCTQYCVYDHVVLHVLLPKHNTCETIWSYVHVKVSAGSVVKLNINSYNFDKVLNNDYNFLKSICHSIV